MLLLKELRPKDVGFDNDKLGGTLSDEGGLSAKSNPFACDLACRVVISGIGYEYDHGELCCPGCRHVVGSWTWTPSVRLTRNGTLEAPLFRISKSIVHHTDLDFDATPSATPRLSEDMSS